MTISEWIKYLEERDLPPKEFFEELAAAHAAIEDRLAESFKGESADMESLW